MIGLTKYTNMRNERGPRWLVGGTIRPGEHDVRYADTADAAERLRDEMNTRGLYQVRVDPPVGAVDLVKLGRDRTDARRVFDEKTAILRAGVLRALEQGTHNESSAAREAGVTRDTIRTWLGKKSTWTVQRHGGLAGFEIFGPDLATAVDRSFHKIARAFEIGNAAGYVLEAVWLEPQGETGAMLHIDARGATLAGRPGPGESRHTQVTITRLSPGDLTERVDLPLNT
ncbi:hypothetical protein [Micromonospora sp. RP3T]|uniref:hypothetical protein n=1 Tax=Micromonospora sp. RP3T TaxID=2135446 RepID=UPI003D7203A8